MVTPGITGQTLPRRLRERPPVLCIRSVPGFTSDAILQHTAPVDSALLQMPCPPGVPAAKAGPLPRGTGRPTTCGDSSDSLPSSSPKYHST
jgi:hypothetical protein